MNKSKCDYEPTS